jgi:hypothetical protein
VSRPGSTLLSIACYFGTKADLYIAAVVAEDAEGLPL